MLARSTSAKAAGHPIVVHVLTAQRLLRRPSSHLVRARLAPSAASSSSSTCAAAAVAPPSSHGAAVGGTRSVAWNSRLRPGTTALATTPRPLCPAPVAVVAAASRRRPRGGAWDGGGGATVRQPKRALSSHGVDGTLTPSDAAAVADADAVSRLLRSVESYLRGDGDKSSSSRSSARQGDVEEGAVEQRPRDRAVDGEGGKLAGDADLDPSVELSADLVLKCLNASKNNDAAPTTDPRQTEALLAILCRRYELTNDPSLRPTTAHFHAAMDHWASSSTHPQSGVEAAAASEWLLRRMEEMYVAETNDAVRPETTTFLRCIDAWSKCARVVGSSSSSSSSSRNSREESTMTPYACAKRAEELLLWMERLRAAGSHDDLKADTSCFNSVIRGWAYMGRKSSAVRAMRIFDLMRDMDASGAYPHVKPDAHTYRAVLSAWSRSHAKDAADRAEQMLWYAVDDANGVGVHPDVGCFNVVMKAHASSRNKADSARKAEAILTYMEEANARGDTDVRPNSESYRYALAAWAWSHGIDAPNETERILFRMIHAEERGNPDVAPTAEDFNTLISSCAFVRCDETDWRRKENVLQIAYGALHALSESTHAQPTSATFAGMIRACVNLLPPDDDRDAKVEELFRTASRLGCVDGRVLRQLRHAVPTDQYISLREDHENFRRPVIEE